MAKNKDIEMKYGVVYEESEPEYIGAMPIRQDIEVIPADEPRQLKLGWTCKEYLGSEIFKADQNGNLIKQSLKNFSDIQVGDDILVAGFFGYIPMKITKINNQDGSGSADSGGTLAILEFSKDDRKSWTSSGLINKRGLKGMKSVIIK